jgi:hypothetical protein
LSDYQATFEKFGTNAYLDPITFIVERPLKAKHHCCRSKINNYFFESIQLYQNADKIFPTHNHLCCCFQVKIQDASSCKKSDRFKSCEDEASAAKGVAPAENRRNSKRLSGDSNIYETTNSRGINQAQITAEQLRFQEEEAERNKDPNANKDTDYNDYEQSEGTQSEDNNTLDDSSEEETLEELVAKDKTSRINSGREIQLQKGLEYTST